MRRVSSLLVAFLVGLVACGDERSERADVTASPSPLPSPVPDATLADYDAQTFSASSSVDNEWYPLVPGTHFVYEGRFTEDGERLQHTVEFTVTDLTKEVDGVEARAIIDRDYIEGELVEHELAFFAQDDHGNVWLMGEYPEEYSDGEFEGAPDTWLAGVKGARAGVMMRAQPSPDTSAYLQGLWDPIEFKDKAQVLRIEDETCTPLDCYRSPLLIQEWNPDEPGAFQLKYYARGVGNVRVGWAGKNEEEKEVLVLTSLEQLDDAGITAVRDEALALERRAYEISKTVYGDTSPLEQSP